MAGLVPAIHVFLLKVRKKDVDARDKRGHEAAQLRFEFETELARLEAA
jgi:hypothetical protein